MKELQAKVEKYGIVIDNFNIINLSFSEEGATEDIDLVPALKDYYKRHMKDGTYVSWLAMDGDKIIGRSDV